MWSRGLYEAVASTLRRASGARRLCTALPQAERVAALRQRVAHESPQLGDFALRRATGGSGSGQPPPRARRPEEGGALAEHAATLSVGAVPRLDASPRLTDRFRRHHSYLRISLTERCSLRCVYCMPADGVSLTRSDRLLSPDEMVRLASLFVREGVDKIRLTGGEPTVRPDLVSVVAALNALRPAGLKQIAMTTNGIALSRALPELRAAGLDKINLSLDTLDRGRFQQLTRRDGLAKVRIGPPTISGELCIDGAQTEKFGGVP
jgi:cyclic pyranopterin phosphate synthase